MLRARSPGFVALHGLALRRRCGAPRLGPPPPSSFSLSPLPFPLPSQSSSPTSPSSPPSPSSPSSRPASASAAAAADPAPVHSLQNPRVRAARALLRRRQRDRAARLLVEGHRLVLDAVEGGAGLAPEALFYTEDALARGVLGDRLRALVRRVGAAPFGPAVLVAPQVMLALSDTVTPQGVVAVLPRPPPARFPTRPTLLLVCDAVQDPGNLGTLLRAAAGAGADAAILTSGCADAWSLKALRAGMGAQLRLPVQTEAVWSDIANRIRDQYECSICVADGDASGGGNESGPTARRPPSIPYAEYDWTKPCALVIGSEADGPSEDARSSSNTRVSIPMANGVESLNAAVAGAILLFEANRQRSQAASSLSAAKPAD